MKNKFSAILYTAAIILITSCSASKSAMAQSNDDYNNNGYSQQPPAPEQDNSNDQVYQNNQNSDQYNNQNNQNFDSQDYTNDNGNNNNQGNYDQGYSDGASAQAQADVNMNDFNTALSPYGSWMNYPSYGRVWICNVRGFRPYYSGGHWAYTNFGWTWASDYSWGWAPFHYGRWAYESAYGWMWVPGYQWGPAWVGWRTGGDYYGWAPLSPGLQIGVGFGGYGNIAAERWCFVPHNYIGYRNITRYYVNPRRNVTIIRNTTVINNVHIYRNTTIVNGPGRSEVERYTGRTLQPMRVVNTSQPGATTIRGNNIAIYHPQRNNVNINPSNQQQVIRPNTQAQQFNGNIQQHNINNLPQRGNGNIINRAPVNQNIQQPVQQPRQQNIPPARPNIQPQPRTVPNNIRPGVINEPKREKEFTPQHQQPQVQRNTESRQFAQRENFGSGNRHNQSGRN